MLEHILSCLLFAFKDVLDEGFFSSVKLDVRAKEAQIRFISGLVPAGETSRVRK